MNGQLKGKKILVQGAGRGNLGLVKAAKRNGVEIVLTGMGGDYPCNSYADKFCYGDISNPDVISRIAKEEKVDGAIICCSDTGLLAIGRCNDTLGLVGISESAAIACSDKSVMKTKFLSKGVRTPKAFFIRTEMDLDAALKEMNFPLIVKAVDLQGSRGISVVRSAAEALNAFQESLSLSKKDYCIIEEFVEGREFGVQAFIYQGKMLFVLPHGDETIMCGAPVPIGHFVPYDVSDKLRIDIQTQVEAAIQSIGLDNCAVNVDLIEKDGQAYILELSGRVGANCLPELVSNYLGIDYYEVILATALGINPLPYFEKGITPTHSMARMIRSNVSGKVLSVDDDIYEQDAYVNLFIKTGSEVRKFSNCNDAIGEIVVKGVSFVDCERKISEVFSNISKFIKYE